MSYTKPCPESKRKTIKLFTIIKLMKKIQFTNVNVKMFTFVKQI